MTLYESLKEFLTIHENISPYPIQRTMNYSPRATMHALKVLLSTRLVRKLNIKTHLHPQPTPKHVPAPASGIHQMWRVCTMSFLSILMYAIVYGYAIPCLLSSYEMYEYITYISLPPDHFSFILFHILSCFLTFSRFFFSFVCVCFVCILSSLFFSTLYSEIIQIPQGICQLYNGTTCEKFLRNQTVFVPPDLTMDNIEERLKAAYGVIKESK